MKKNKLTLVLGLLSLLTTFKVAAELIPITIGANDTFELGLFMTDNSGKTYKAVQYLSLNKDSLSIQNPDFTWYTFDTTGYTGGNKITTTINPRTPNAFTVQTYKHLFIDDKGVNGENNGMISSATLRTVNAPKGTFKIFGINPMTRKINYNVGFIVTVE